MKFSDGSLYINATDLSGHRALLQSKVIEVNANSTDFCLKFDYKVDGPNGGNLNVYVKHVQGFMPYHIWSRGRQQDSEWNTAQVAFSSADNFVVSYYECCSIFMRIIRIRTRGISSAKINQMAFFGRCYVRGFLPMARFKFKRFHFQPLDTDEQQTA
ncbi:hypothetical protein DPMN_148674 [Dreissena polymorpha]|uniref:MAM domain-containing protein n=1 Tax=Dreissena polymorpha TaxID=45954 RepID=A0A9D4FAE2_DREPO|nr:hypothetical protein DPMN_148674 [Dreissena polymorpha]